MIRSLLLAVGFASSLTAAEFSINQEPSGDVAILLDGELFTRYVTSDAESNKTYFWPLIGSTGSELTRAYPMETRDGEAHDHPHHRSLWFGAQSIGGFDTWHERATWIEKKKKGKDLEKLMAITGSQSHTGVTAATTEGNTATLSVTTDHLSPDGEVFLKDERTITFTAREDGTRVIDFDLTLIGVKESVEVLDKKDTGFNLRVAHNLTVDAKEGGEMLNSRGDEGEDAWGKRADWVTYYGTLDDKPTGITMLNHPDSYNYPTPWHARTYGLFTANPFGLEEVADEKKPATFDLKKDDRILLRHRILLHPTTPTETGISAEWSSYTH